MMARSGSVRPAPLAAWLHSRPASENPCFVRVLVRCYNWALWGFLTVVLFAQVFGIFYAVVASKQHAFYGRDPLKEVYPIEGFNDEPYSDRMIACVLQGRLFKPIQVKAALDNPSKSVVVDSNGSTVNGYRVCARDKLSINSINYEPYLQICDSLGSSLDAIFGVCTALGYNVTRDALRVVDDIHSITTKIVLNSLPVMVMPYWDNGQPSRFAIPGWDGSACVFRLTTYYNAAGDLALYLNGINRTAREETTAMWLGRPGGEWRNGWYEDGSGMRWYSDLISTIPTFEHGVIFQRQFNVTVVTIELDRYSSAIPSTPFVQTLGESLSFTDEGIWYNSVAVSNGSRFGLFLYEGEIVTSVMSKYSISILVSNLSLSLLLFRWCLAILTMQWSSEVVELVGIGSLSALRYFILLPVLLLPRLKTTIAAFFVVGCQFEGEQKALAEAWFIVYPAIGEFVLFYYSLLNLLAKLLRRRVSDVLFGPTLVFFYFMHRFRFELAQSGWLEFDGRIATVVLSQEFDKLRLMDFFTSDAAFRMNGNIKSLFTVKMVVLALNLAPFLWSTTTNVSPIDVPLLGVENALVLRAVTLGGLGRPFRCEVGQDSVSKKRDVKGSASSRSLPCYELIRLGYVVLGDRYMISIKDWFWLMVFSSVRSHQPFSNLQVCTFAITRTKDGGHCVHPQPRFVSASDSTLSGISCFNISAHSLR